MKESLISFTYERMIKVKIMKKCKQEIITYETTSLPNEYVRKMYDLDGNLKKEKKKNINDRDRKFGGKFALSTQQAFDYLISNEGYFLV